MSISTVISSWKLIPVFLNFHEMNDSILDLYLSREEPAKSCLLTLRDMILNFSNNISETIKYGAPCFLYQKKILCYLMLDKKKNKPYILFANGLLLDHPLLELGKRKKMKVFYVDPASDLPKETISQLIEMAISLKS